MRINAAKLYHLVKSAELIFFAHRLKPEPDTRIADRLHNVRERVACKIHRLVTRDL